MRGTRRVAITMTAALLATVLVPFGASADPVAPDPVTDEITLDGAPVVEVPAEERAALPEVVAEVREAELDLGIATAESFEQPTEPGVRSGTIEAPIAFTSLHLELPEGLDEVAVRTSADGQAWSEWAELELFEPEDGPDQGTDEDAATTTARVTGPFLGDEARFVQLEADAAAEDLGEVTVQVTDVDGLNESTVARLIRALTPSVVPAEASSMPSWVNSRQAWGAAAPRGTPSVARNGVQQVVVHHTATPNDLGDCNQARIASRIRGMQSYHQNTQGWSDIGYNVIIDPCGGVWEGRAGGLDRAVVGAHARGFNTGSTGVSVIGDFTTRGTTPTILQALDRVVGWKAGIHGFDTTGRVTIGGTSYPTVIGHRDVGQTSCPGSIHDQLPRIRTNAKSQSTSYPQVPDGLNASSFSDITGSPHKAAIEELVARSVTDGFGDGTFRPTAAVTRGQVATFLGRALNIPQRSGSGIRDVAGSPHERYIYALTERGILTGYSDGTFRPQEPLRREHMAVIIARALDLRPDPAAAGKFPDVRAYRDEIGAIVTAKITTGRSNGTFGPSLDVNRGQMATFVINALANVER